MRNVFLMSVMNMIAHNGAHNGAWAQLVPASLLSVLASQSHSPQVQLELIL